MEALMIVDDRRRCLSAWQADALHIIINQYYIDNGLRGRGHCCNLLPFVYAAIDCNYDFKRAALVVRQKYVIYKESSGRTKRAQWIFAMLTALPLNSVNVHKLIATIQLIKLPIQLFSTGRFCHAVENSSRAGWEKREKAERKFGEILALKRERVITNDRGGSLLTLLVARRQASDVAGPLSIPLGSLRCSSREWDDGRRDEVKKNKGVKEK